ncbi:MAG: DEAD/DEAH box helicase, partial [Chrysiogenales bacterium]
MNIHEKNTSARQSERPFKKNQPACSPSQSRSSEAPGVFATLLPELKRAVAEEGYATPTPIQTQAIPHLLAGRDLIGCAQTGTGKTAAFILPILQYLTLHKRQPERGRARVLVLTPTRELAAQINESASTYGRHMRFRHAVIFGG